MSLDLNEKLKLDLEEAGDLIMANPTLRIMLAGEPGIGKTSIVARLQDLTGMDAAILDVPGMDLGDIAMPVIDHETRTTRYYPNARFGFHTGQPMIICLDEYTKGATPIKNMLHPLLEQFRPRLGDVLVPTGAWPNGQGEGSLLFLTGNNETDGVGDSLQGHTRQRVLVCEVRKPSYEIWRRWADANNAHPIIKAWADQFQYAFASYTDGDQGSNEFIFHPNKEQDGCFSPRTAMIASTVLWSREHLTPNALTVALIGAVGKAAAESIANYVQFKDQMPSLREILDAPMKCRIPTQTGAQAVLVFSAVELVEKDTIDPLLSYVDRISPEWATIFCCSVARHKTKQTIAYKSKRFTDWVTDNEDIL